MFDLETRFVLHRQFRRLFARNSRLITHHRRFRITDGRGDDIPARRRHRKIEVRGNGDVFRRNFRELLAVAIPINERRELFLDGLGRDVIQIRVHRHAGYFGVVLINGIDADFDAARFSLRSVPLFRDVKALGKVCRYHRP